MVEESWENYILVKKAEAGLGGTQTEKASDWLLQIWFIMVYHLVGGLEHFLFSIIYGIILPID